MILAPAPSSWPSGWSAVRSAGRTLRASSWPCLRSLRRSARRSRWVPATCRSRTPSRSSGAEADRAAHSGPAKPAVAGRVLLEVLLVVVLGVVEGARLRDLGRDLAVAGGA